MFKITLAVVWLGVNLLSAIQTFRKPLVHLDSGDPPVSAVWLALNLRGFLSQRQEGIVQFHETLVADLDLQRNFRQGLLFTTVGLLVELVVYGAITFSFEFWGALIFGGLVMAVHIQSLILLGLLAILTSNREWFILTYKKAQLLVKPAVIIEILWLAYLVLYWLGL